MILTHLALFQFLGGASAANAPVPPPEPGIRLGTEGSYRRKSFRYDRWGRKKKQALRKSPEAVQIVEQIAEAFVEQPDYSWLTKAVAALEAQLASERISAAKVYIELLELERERLASEAEDDDLLLFS